MMQITPSYYRIMAGAKSVFAQEFLEGGFIAANWNIDQDLTHDLPDDWREFNHRFIPVYLNALPDKTKISAGLACGMLHTLSKGITQGEPYRVCRRLNILRDYSDEKTKLYPRN